MRVARIDFSSAWIVALLAYALYVGQAVKGVQFADFLTQSRSVWQVILGFFAGFNVVAGGFELLRHRREGMHRFGIAMTFLGLISIPCGVLILKSSGRSPHWSSIVYGFLLGLITVALNFGVKLLPRPLKERRPAKGLRELG